MILHCVRHGESEDNRRRRIQGQADSPLSDLGSRQAQALADHFAAVAVDEVASSPLRRARATAEAIASRHGLSVRVDARLMEIHAGIFQGASWSEVEANHAEVARRWRDDPAFAVPGGESRLELRERARAAFSELGGSGHDHVIVVAHGGILQAALAAALGIPAEQRPFLFANASVSRLQWPTNREPARLLSLNDTSHLLIAGCPTSTAEL